MLKRALVTGFTGQDAYYLSKLLISKNYEVSGLVRGQNNPKLPIVEKLLPEAKIVYGDLLDESSLARVIYKSQPDEIYNLGAISFVEYSFDNPVLTCNVTGLGTVRLLELIRHINPKIKFYQSSSAEMYGKTDNKLIDETTPFNPQSPYAIAKVLAFNSTKYYREAYGMFCSNGILFNHESPFRGTEFVTRKISRGVARISLGKQDIIHLGNLDARRDWGFAGDYILAMYKMLQHSIPDDFVIATQKAYSVREFLNLAFKYIGISNWNKYVEFDDPRYIRPLDVFCLAGNYAKAKKELDWEPKIKIDELVKMMVDNDLELEKSSTNKS